MIYVIIEFFLKKESAQFFQIKTAICTILKCENGYCSAPETCSCYPGYQGLQCDLPIINPVISPSNNLNIIAIIAPIVVVVLIIILIIFFIIFRNKLSRRRYRPKATQPVYKNLIFGINYKKFAYSYSGNKPDYSPLLQVLFFVSTKKKNFFQFLK